LLAFVELIIALGLAAYAQHIIDDAGSYGSGWFILSRFDDELNDVYRIHQSVAFSIPMFLVAGILFAHSVSQLAGIATAHDRGDEEPPPGLAFGRRTRFLALALALIALGCSGVLFYQLAGGGNQSSNWWLFWASTALACAALLLIDVPATRRAVHGLRWGFLEYAFVLHAVAFFIGLMLHDLTSWQYARIGDEGVFWEFGKRIAERDHDFNYFSLRGPFGLQPVMTSVYQGMVMRAAGTEMFGWKLSSVIAIAATLPAFYWLLRNTISLRAAVFATAILACSHVMFAYAHTGYNNVFAIAPAVYALAFYVQGERSRSLLFLFLSGVFAGFGFYTFYSARIVIGILALAVLFTMYSGYRRDGLRWFAEVPLPIASGFWLVAAPMFAVHGWDTIEVMEQRSVWCCSPWQDALVVVLESIPRAFLGFSFHTGRIHYVSGSLLDEISAVLALLGLAYAISRVMQPGYRLLVIWAIAAIVATGVLHQHPLTEMPSRLNFAIPPMAAMAALALDRTTLAVSAAFRNQRVDLVLGIAVFAIVVPAIFAFNAHRFWEVTPSLLQLSPGTVVYREATNEPCNAEGQRNVVFSVDGGYESGISVFLWYGDDDRGPLFLSYQGPLDVYDDLLAATNVGCLMFIDPEHELARPVAARYAGALVSPGGGSHIATDPSGRTKVLVVPLTPDSTHRPPDKRE